MQAGVYTAQISNRLMLALSLLKKEYELSKLQQKIGKEVHAYYIRHIIQHSCIMIMKILHRPSGTLCKTLLKSFSLTIFMPQLQTAVFSVAFPSSALLTAANASDVMTLRC